MRERETRYNDYVYVLYIQGVPDLTNQPLIVDSWDHLEAKILIPKCWGRLHKNVQTTHYCRIEDTIAPTAEFHSLLYIHPSIDIDIIALYAGPLMRYSWAQENVTRRLVIFNLL